MLRAKAQELHITEEEGRSREFYGHIVQTLGDTRIRGKFVWRWEECAHLFAKAKTKSFSSSFAPYIQDSACPLALLLSRGEPASIKHGILLLSTWVLVTFLLMWPNSWQTQLERRHSPTWQGKCEGWNGLVHGRGSQEAESLGKKLYCSVCSQYSPSQDEALPPKCSPPARTKYSNMSLQGTWL